MPNIYIFLGFVVFVCLNKTLEITLKCKYCIFGIALKRALDKSIIVQLFCTILSIPSLFRQFKTNSQYNLEANNIEYQKYQKLINKYFIYIDINLLII